MWLLFKDKFVNYKKVYKITKQLLIIWKEI